MGHTREVRVRVRLGVVVDGARVVWVARSTTPPLEARGETPEAALEALQEAVLFASQADYPGLFGGDFTASATLVSFDVVREGVPGAAEDHGE